MSRHRCLFLSCIFHTFKEFIHHLSSSGSFEIWGFKDFNWGWRNGEPWNQPTQHSSLHPPAWVWPLTLRWPVAFRHPLQCPLKWCLLECTVGLITHLERAARNSIQWVCWPVLSEGSKGGLEIKGEAVCEVNSREQYFTCAEFSQRMLMSAHFWCIGLTEWLLAAGLKANSSTIINVRVVGIFFIIHAGMCSSHTPNYSPKWCL